MSNESRPTGQTEPQLDREALNAVMLAGSEPGVYFGKGLDLTPHDREQFQNVINKTEAALEPQYQDPDWIKFMELVAEGRAKGVLNALRYNEGTKIPAWCVDGGEDPEVKKTLRLSPGGANGASIQVPRRIYNLFHWTQTIDDLKMYVTSSDETLKGRSPASLVKDLRHLAHFAKHSEQNAESEAPKD